MATLSRFQHLPKIPHKSKQSVSRRDHDPVQKASERISRGVSLLVLLQTSREVFDLLTVDLGHLWMHRGFRRFREGGSERELPAV